MSEPIFCFGQQPCGFFPKRFLVAKFITARRLRAEFGGEIVFFYHDSDHDPRETRTILRHRKTGVALDLNFAIESPLQRKFSPLYLKRIRADWQEKTASQLLGFVARPWIEAFRSVDASDPAGFCLEMYRQLGLLEGVRVIRSSDPTIREAACDVDDFFVDVPHEGEIVRARWSDGKLRLHKGGGVFIDLPVAPIAKPQVSPTRDTRLRWMQSVVGCTHYIAGAGEQAYLHRDEAPDITFIPRDPIDRSDEAYTDFPL